MRGIDFHGALHQFWTELKFSDAVFFADNDVHDTLEKNSVERNQPLKTKPDFPERG
jgi:hypothetical protein